MGITFCQFIVKSNNKSDKSQPSGSNVCSSRGKSYCLVHNKYFAVSWCPDCSRLNRH